MAPWLLAWAWAWATGCTVVLPSDPGPDASVPDQGPSPTPCRLDTEDCGPGQVCHLPSGQCVPGVPCVSDAPSACSECVQEDGCGHGRPLEAVCRPDHGSVCVRTRTACEPCTEDAECGPQPATALGPGRCVVDGNQSVCAPPCRTDADCPVEFNFRCAPVGPGLDKRACIRPQGCESLRLDLCPFVGGAQEPYETPCPGGGYCATNRNPNRLGLCLGRCVQDEDCERADQICNRRRGVCQDPCRPRQCASANDPPQVCHGDGLCGRPCDAEDGPDDWCRDRFEQVGVHCNLAGPSREPPFERDLAWELGACLPTCVPGVCPGGQTCWAPTASDVPGCRSGCQSRADCFSGDRCVDAAPGQSVTEQACRTLPALDGSTGEVGTCCAPGPP